MNLLPGDLFTVTTKTNDYSWTTHIWKVVAIHNEVVWGVSVYPERNYGEKVIIFPPSEYDLHICPQSVLDAVLAVK